MCIAPNKRLYDLQKELNESFLKEYDLLPDSSKEDTSPRTISIEDILTYVREFSVKKGIDQKDWEQYENEAVNYVKARVGGIIPIVEKIIPETPNLLNQADKWISDINSKVTRHFNDKEHTYEVTLSDGTKYTTSLSVTQLAYNYAHKKDLFSASEPVKVHPGIVMGNSFDKAVKSYFEVGHVVADENLPKQAVQVIEDYLSTIVHALDTKYGEGKWKAYTMNIAASGNYKYQGKIFSIGGMPDIIIATENEWLILDAKTTSVGLDETAMEQYSMQTSMYRRLFEDSVPELKGKISTGLLVAQTEYPKSLRGKLKGDTLYFGVYKATDLGSDIYNLNMYHSETSTFLNGLLMSTYYTPLAQSLDVATLEELKEMGIDKEDIMPSEDPEDSYTSPDSIIDSDDFKIPVTKEELNTLSSGIMNLYSYYINQLGDEKIRYKLGISDDHYYNKDGSIKEREQLVSDKTIFKAILSAIRKDVIVNGYIRTKDPKFLWASKNWDIVINNGLGQLVRNENIDKNLQKTLSTEKLTDDVIDLESVETAEESEREPYSMSAVEVPVESTMSAELKSILSSIPVRKWERRTEGDVTEMVPIGFEYDETWHIPKFVSQEDVVATLCYTLYGSVDRADMLERLTDAAPNYPFIYNVLEVLENNPDIWPLFYQTFNKMKMNYMAVKYTMDKRIGLRHPMAVELKDKSIVNKQLNIIYNTIKSGRSSVFTVVDKGGGVRVNKEELKALLSELDTIWNLPNKNAIPLRLSTWTSKALIALGVTDSKILANSQISVESVRRLFKILKAKSLRDIINVSKDQDIRRAYYSIVSRTYENSPYVQSLSLHYNKKNYQRYVSPNYVGTLIDRMTNTTHFTSEEIQQFIDQKFLNNAFYYYTDADGNKQFVNKFIEELYKGWFDETKIRHFIEVNTLGKQYADMGDSMYILSLLSEYRAFRNTNDYLNYANFPLPVLSDKPSSEFISMRKYSFMRDAKKAKDAIIDNSKGYIYEELSRIATVIAMLKNNAEYIENFSIKESSVPKSTLKKIRSGEDLTFSDFVKDGKLLSWAKESGASFKFLEFLNNEIVNKTELGTILLDFINGHTHDEGTFMQLFNDAYNNDMDRHGEDFARLIRDNTPDLGRFKYMLGVTDDAELDTLVEEFIWNYVYNERNLLNLLIGDPSFYPNSVQLVKRFAQVHSYTDKVDKDATFKDPNTGERVRYSDGKQRVLIVSDKHIGSLLSGALKKLFLKKARDTRSSDERKIYLELAEKAKMFNDINVTDGQAFGSPTGFFKKYGMLGILTPEQRDLYFKIKDGNYTAEELANGFPVIKPFTYSTVPFNTGTSSMPQIGIPTQLKDSEYMLSLAGELIRKSDDDSTEGQVLKAFYDLMEESAYDGKRFNGKGIDLIAFQSATKTGAYNVIDITELEKADDKLKYLKSHVYNADGSYTDAVHEIPFADWGRQQKVPNDFMDSTQAMGSQQRILSVAELPEDFNVEFNGKTYNKESFIKHYFSLINDVMQLEYDTVKDIFKMDGSRKKKNKAVSEILRQNIMKDSRYSSELLWGVSLTDGNFNIPLGDNSSTSRMPGMLFSIIKNHINKMKMPGGPVVQVTGYDRDLKINLIDKDGKKLLSYYDYIQQNNLDDSKESIDKWNDYLVENDFRIKDFDFDITAPTDEIERKVIAGEKITEDERRMLGYRIPTENKYSMFHGRVRKFLSRASGEVVMLPYEITLISGLDFDVDKLYTMFKYTHDNLTTIEKLKNEIFEMEYLVLQQQSSMVDSMNPGGFDTLKALANRYNPNDLNSANIIYPDVQVKFHNMNMSGKKLVAFAANSRISHAICEMLDMKIKVNKFIVDGISSDSLLDADGYYSIGNIYSPFNHSRIPRILSELLAAAVDNGKDPVLARLGITPVTFNMAATMIRLGLPIEFVSAMLLQPSIQIIAKDAEIQNMSFEDALEEIFEELVNKSDMTLGQAVKSIRNINFKTESLIDSMNRKTKENVFANIGFLYNMIPATANMKRIMFWTRLNSTSNAVNADIYRDLVYTMQLQDFYSRTRDNSGEISLTYNQLFDNVKFLKVLSNVYTDLLPDLCGNLFPQYSRGFMSLVRMFSEIGIPYEKFSSWALKRIFNQYQVYLATKDIIDSSMRGRYNIIKNSPKILESIRGSIKSEFLDNLTVEDSPYTDVQDIFLDISTLQKEESSRLTASWEALINTNSEVAGRVSDRLVSYSLLKYGMGWSPRNFLGIAPNKAKTHYGNSIGYRQLTDANSALWKEDNPNILMNFIRQFARNNPEILSKPVNYIEAIISNGKTESKIDPNYRMPVTETKDGYIIDKTFYETKMPGTLTIVKDKGEIYVIDIITPTSVSFRRTTPLGVGFNEYNYHEDAFIMEPLIAPADVRTKEIEDEDSDSSELDGSENVYEAPNSTDISFDDMYGYLRNKFGMEKADNLKSQNRETVISSAKEMLEQLKKEGNPSAAALVTKDALEKFIQEKTKDICQ